jgi:hypothetical protein
MTGVGPTGASASRHDRLPATRESSEQGAANLQVLRGLSDGFQQLRA